MNARDAGWRLGTPLLLAVAALLSGCAHSASCLKPQRYDSAESIPVLRGAGGMVVPQAAGALVVPPIPAHPVPFGSKSTTANGKQAVNCLDQPPPIPQPQSDFVTQSVERAAGQ